MPIWIAQAKTAPAEAWLVAGNYDEGLVGHALLALCNFSKASSDRHHVPVEFADRGALGPMDH